MGGLSAVLFAVIHNITAVGENRYGASRIAQLLTEHVVDTTEIHNMFVSRTINSEPRFNINPDSATTPTLGAFNGDSAHP
jgi:hypothetical protein